MKRFSALLIIKEKQNKTTMIYHLIPVRMTFIKKDTCKTVLVIMWEKRNPEQWW
jgi:hypothetical protein